MTRVIASLTPPLARQYTIFERDQVLTHTQLNGLACWLDQQDRLSRISLTGTGLLGGIRPTREGSSVLISPGLGITGDGDLVRLDSPWSLTRWRAYESTAPRYEPFFDATSGLALISGELVGEDDPLGIPLTEQPNALDGHFLILLVESSDTDRDLCTGADCDNLGQERHHRLRILLAPHHLSRQLTSGPLSVAERAVNLPELMAYRPRLDAGLTLAEHLAARQQAAIDQTLADLSPAFERLTATFPELIEQVFAGNPFPRLQERLGNLRSQLDIPLTQLFSDLLKDLVVTWNELRTALLDDDSTLLLPPSQAGKHLGLGSPAQPAWGRSGFYPAIAHDGFRQRQADACFLLTRLAGLVEHYQPPTDKSLQVTPSQGEEHPLAERAIPWYYDPGIAPLWNRRLALRGLAGHNLGYRARDYGGSKRALTPLAGDIAGHAFFRVEGHLGRPVESVSVELRKLIAEHNLPFEVHGVLAHNRRERIRLRPGIRYTDLHRIHYLLRQDISLRLEESGLFTETFTRRLQSAITEREIPDQTESGASVLQVAGSARTALESLSRRAKPALDTPRYSSYQATTRETRWNNGISETLGTLGAARVNLGTLSRSDFVSPVDSLIQTTHPLWLDWLDDLIQGKDNQEDDRLLLSRFIAEHPGLDHLGGVWRGGCFVLVYDDSGNVIGDFTLPYPCAEADEEEPVEPPLQRPPLRRPPLDIEPVRVTPPVGAVVGKLVGEAVSSRFETARSELVHQLQATEDALRNRLETQTASIEGLVKGVFSTREATGADLVLPGKTIATGNPVVDAMVRDVETKRQKVQTLVELASRNDLAEADRTQAQALLGKAQEELGSALADTTEQVVRQSTGSQTSSTVAVVLANSAAYVTQTDAAASLGTRLETLKAGSDLNAHQTLLLNNIQSMTRLRG
ncbi:hypothetical protein [Zoogloea sp.]|uniref:hypothetical protein n=1 Tax=Zoogloea sp. TaxID=49181 RepID=UPI00260EBE88|nr:hypothetical protein [Zoogloea sp.]MDD3355245.1 hypothetical protein [Zoogloea sp.]